jgi:hypothetical protein
MDRTRQAIAVGIVLALLVMPAAATTAPSNDERSGATTIPSLPYATVQDVSDATLGIDDPTPDWVEGDCFDGEVDTGDRTVWYRYTPDADERLIVSTAGTTYPHTIQVWEASGPTLRVVACGYQYPSGQGEPETGHTRSFQAVAGREYIILIGQVLWDHYGPPPEQTPLNLSLGLRVLDVDIAVDQRAYLNLAKGTVTATGTIRCSERFVDVDVRVSQGTGRNSVTATTSPSYTCDAEQRRFRLNLSNTGDGRLTGGPARLRLAWIPRDDWYGDPTTMAQTIRLTACTRIGTMRDDTLTGGSGTDRLCGLDGDDRLLGGGGRDVLFGGAGHDILDGGRGEDRCIGGPGRDRFRSCEVRQQ